LRATTKKPVSFTALAPPLIGRVFGTGQTDGRSTDGRMDRQTDGQTDGGIAASLNALIYNFCCGAHNKSTQDLEGGQLVLSTLAEFGLSNFILYDRLSATQIRHRRVIKARS